jgi:hypothetical protein
MTRIILATRLTLSSLVLLVSVAGNGPVAFGASLPHRHSRAETAGDCGCAPRPQDQLWYINTRSVETAHADSAAEPNFQIGRYDHEQGWLPSNLSDFLSHDDPQIPTVFYVHGNRIEEDECAPRGRLVYHALACQSPSDKPLRFVIWSWPADKSDGPLHDVRAKAQRTELEGYYLGWLLSRLDPQVRVSVIGYSFGARVTTGALHVSAGGELSGRSLPDCGGPCSRRVRVVLLAAALANHWLLPGEHHALALSQVDRLLLLYNSCDYALRHFWLLEFDRRQQALGCTGLAGAEQLGELAQGIVQWDVCGEVGRLHNRDGYFKAPYMVDEIRRYVMWEPLDTP